MNENYVKCIEDLKNSEVVENNDKIITTTAGQCNVGDFRILVDFYEELEQFGKCFQVSIGIDSQNKFKMLGVIKYKYNDKFFSLIRDLAPLKPKQFDIYLNDKYIGCVTVENGILTGYGFPKEFHSFFGSSEYHPRIKGANNESKRD